MRKTFTHYLATFLVAFLSLTASADNTDEFRIRYHDFWWNTSTGERVLTGRPMPKDAEDHYHYKGLMPTNREEGVFINFCIDGSTTVYGPDQTKAHYAIGGSGEVYILEIEEDVTYDVHEISAGSVLDKDRWGFIVPIEHGPSSPSYGATFVDVEVWKDDEGNYKMRAHKLANEERKLFVCGELEGYNWQREDLVPEEDRIYLTETTPGSLIFQGVIKTVAGGTFCLFAPRYPTYPGNGSIYDWQEQRIGYRTPVVNGTIALTEWEWQEGTYLNEIRRWSLPAGEWVVTLDFNRNYFHNETWGNKQPSIQFHSLKHSVDVGHVGWATFAPKMDVNPNYTVTRTSDGTELDANLAKVYYVTNRLENYELITPEVKTAMQSGDAIAKGEGLLVKAPEGTTVNFYFTSDEPKVLEGNWLIGTLEDTPRPIYGTHAYYILGKRNNKVAFYRWASGPLGVYKSFLSVPLSAGSPEIFSFSETDETSIQALPEESDKKLQITEIFNLAGQRIQRMQRGVSIVNGKKVLF